MGVFAVFSDNNYEGPSRLIRSTERLSRPPIGTHGSVWAHAVMWENKKTWTGFPEPLHKPRERQKIHFCRMQLQPCWFCEKKLLFYLSSRPWKSWGGPYPDSQVHGAIQLFLTEARHHGDTFTLLRPYVYTETHIHYTLSQGRHKYKQFLDNNTRTHNLVKDAY